LDKRKALLNFAFIAYLLFLIWGILFKFNIGHTLLRLSYPGDFRTLNFIPFAASGGPAEILFNVLIFIPFGLFLDMVREKSSFLFNLCLVLLLSLSFETLQYIFAIGASDITDVITNTTGGLIGLTLCRITQKKSIIQIILTVLFLAIALAITLLMLSHGLLRK